MSLARPDAVLVRRRADGDGQCGDIPGPWTTSTMTAMATVSAAGGRPDWVRPALVTVGGLTATGAVLAVVRLPVLDSTVWAESLAVAGSTVALVAVTCWLT